MTTIPAGTAVRSSRPEDEMGITYRQLDYWVHQGYLRPHRRRKTPSGTPWGQGIRRIWPASELEIGRRMARLTAAGLTPERAAAFAREGWPAGEIAPGVRIEVTP